MSESNILCNYKNCQRVLNGFAFITRCSHAFCELHGSCDQFNQMSKQCPACSSPLTQKMDLVRVNLNPNEEFKSMVLAGLQPEIVMDIATRAIMFWTFQQHQQSLHKDFTIKNLKDVLSTTKAEAKADVGKLQSDIANMKRKLEEMEREFEIQKMKLNETCDKLSEKTRENHKLQLVCENLKRRHVSVTMMQKHQQQQQQQQFQLKQCNKQQKSASRAPQAFDIDIVPAGPNPRVDFNVNSPMNQNLPWMFSNSPFDGNNLLANNNDRQKRCASQLNAFPKSPSLFFE